MDEVLGVTPCSPKIQISWILGCHPSTPQINWGPSLSPQPESEDQQMATGGSILGMILKKQHRTEWSKWRQTTTIILKVILKLWEKFNFLSGKIFLWVNQLWTRLLLIWNTNSRTTSPIDLITVGTKTPEPTPLTWPTKLPEKKMEKRTYQMNQTQTHHCQTHHQRKRNAIKIKSITNTRKMICQTHHQATILIRPTIMITNASCVRVRDIEKNHQIKLCACLTAKVADDRVKSKIIRFKMDEDLLQRRIYFLTFLESQEMIFSKYTETCEVLLDHPK